MPTLQRFLTHHPCEHILRNASDNADFTSATRHRPDEALDFVLCPGKKIPRLIIGQDQLPGLSLPLNTAADRTFIFTGELHQLGKCYAVLASSMEQIRNE